MIDGLLPFAATQLAVAVFGASIAMLPSLRKCSLASRAAIAWLAGATSIGMVAPLLSLAGVWGERSIAIPLLAIAIAAPLAARRRAHAARLSPEPPPSRWTWVPLLLSALAVIVLAHGIASGRAVSTEAFTMETAKASRWAADGIDPSLFTLSDPSATPVPSTTAMWTAMHDQDVVFVAVPWIQMVLLIVFVVVARTPCRRLLDPAASSLAVAGITLIVASAVLAGQMAGSAMGWLVVLAPLALLLSVAPGTPIMFLVAVAAAASASHRAGIFIALALAVIELTRQRPNRALWIAASGTAALLPWWILLASKGLAPWSGAIAAAGAEWHIVDSGLIVVAIVSLLLIGSRWRRARELAPALLLIAVMTGIAITHSSDGGGGFLLALRLTAPLLLSGAALVSLRPLPTELAGFQTWTYPVLPSDTASRS